MKHEFAYKSQKTPLCFSQGGWFEKKKSQIKFQSKWDIMNKYVGSCLLLFVQFLKIY